MFTRELRIQPLTRAKVPQSFPLVQLAMPQLSLDLWQDYALDHISLGGIRDGGILKAGLDPLTLDQAGTQGPAGHEECWRK